jgi:DNA-binding winged helix-turn-helix (wHTH) protein
MREISQRCASESIKLWPADTFVDFDRDLNRAVNQLRDALNDSAESPRFIETFPKRGYRFIAAVEDSNAAAERTTPVPPAAAKPEHGPDHPAQLFVCAGAITPEHSD